MKSKTTGRTILALAIIVCLTQCGGGSKDSTAPADEKEPASGAALAEASAPQFQVENGFKRQLSHIFEAYLKVKDACVATDPVKVKAEAKVMLKILRTVETRLLTGAALNDWATYANQLEMTVVEITASEDIELQRAAFSTLSGLLYKSIKAYGLGFATAYYEFCPMAFNNTGAYWLSESQDIRNPYFGDKMMTCGRVEEKLQ